MFYCLGSHDDILPEHVFFPVIPPLALLLHQLSQPTAQLFGFDLYCWLLLRRYVAPHPCICTASAALDVLAQRGALSQELLLPRAPHLVQVDGSFPLTKTSCSYCSSAVKKEMCRREYDFFCRLLFLRLGFSSVHININLCPSCLHTTAAFRSFQPESQILPQSPWRYTSTRPSFLLLLPPTRRTRGPDRKKTLIDIHVYASSYGRIHSLRASYCPLTV